MSHNSDLEEDEIGIRELFAALWSHKLFIVLFTGLSIFLAGFYTTIAEKKIYGRNLFFKLNKMIAALALIFPS